jgi:hypothetical protein
MRPSDCSVDDRIVGALERTQGGNTKRFVLAHIFRITSDGDYSAHRRLWLYLAERMREELQAWGVTRPDR